MPDLLECIYYDPSEIYNLTNEFCDACEGLADITMFPRFRVKLSPEFSEECRKKAAEFDNIATLLRSMQTTGARPHEAFLKIADAYKISEQQKLAQYAFGLFQGIDYDIIALSDYMKLTSRMHYAEVLRKMFLGRRQILRDFSDDSGAGMACDNVIQIAARYAEGAKAKRNRCEVQEAKHGRDYKIIQIVKPRDFE